MVRYVLYCLLLLLPASYRLQAQDGYVERAKKYVEQYYPLAISEQRASGIPASVILGQGILETEAGASELMVKANNHFGIKCKNNWQGPTFLHTDDAKDECFKKYESAEESYKDHSAHLINNPRYAPLFKCSKTDYAAWAVGLKRCGYATNPQYAQRLIKIIEDFRLQEYTYAALDSYMLHTYPALVDESPEQVFVSKDPPLKEEYVRDTTHRAVKDTLKSKGLAATSTDTTQKWKAADTSAISLAETDPLKRIADSMNEVLRHNVEQEQIHAAASSDSAKIEIVNGLKAFAAAKGESLLEYAVKYKIRYPHLLELNDLSDAPLPFDMYVYLEKKLTSGTHDKHIVKEGETMLMVAQREGMQLKRLLAMNLFTPGEEPMAGTGLELPTSLVKKTPINLNPFKQHKENTEPVVKDTTTVRDSNWTAAYKAPVYSSLPDDIDTTVKEKNTLTPPPPGRHDVETFGAGAGNKNDTGSKGYITTTKNKPLKSQKDMPNPGDKKPSAILPANTAAVKQDTTKHDDLSSGKTQFDQTVANSGPKRPSIKDDPQQPQLNKPPTEKEYKKGDKFYIVKRGDTAYSIAKRNEITVAQLLKWNDTEPQDIKAGQTLKVKE